MPERFGPEPKEDRISNFGLTEWKFGGKTFVVHRQPGCPKNATIEAYDTEEGRWMRCWTCKRPLTSAAVAFVQARYRQTDQGTFIIPDPQ